MIIWLTGLPCSGKTTIGREVARHLNAEFLDGDELRGSCFSAGIGFKPEDREAHLLRVGEMARRLNQYTDVVCAFIAPFAKTRRKLPADLWVYVKCPAEVCAARDPKGMWARAKAGAIRGFTGYDAPYEAPKLPNVVLDTTKTPLDDCVRTVLGACPPRKAHSLFIGRYQPLHAGHVRLIKTVLDEGRPVCVGLRDTGINKDNPYSIQDRKDMFWKVFGKRVKVIVLPDIAEVCYGRSVGWGIREIRLDAATEAVSATKIRNGKGGK